MAKKKQKKQQQAQDPGGKGKKSGAGSKQQQKKAAAQAPKKAAPPKHKPQPAKPLEYEQYAIAPKQGYDSARQSLDPLSLVLLAAGLGMLAFGLFRFVQIQYMGASAGGYWLAFAMFTIGLLLSCLAPPRMRNWLAPRRDPMEAFEVVSAGEAAQRKKEAQHKKQSASDSSSDSAE